MKTTTYQNAVSAIRTYSESRQAELDALAATRRQEHIVAARAACMAGVEEGTPAAAVCALVAQTLTVGREDGYPEYRLPDEVWDAIQAARAAGLLTATVGALKLYSDNTRGFAGTVSLHDADYHAWLDAKEYRAAQTWAKL